MESEMYGESPDERAERLEIEGRCRHCEQFFDDEHRCVDCGSPSCQGWEIQTPTGPVASCCDCAFERERDVGAGGGR